MNIHRHFSSKFSMAAAIRRDDNAPILLPSVDVLQIALSSLFRHGTAHAHHQSHYEGQQDGDPERDPTNRSSCSHIDPPCASIRTHCSAGAKTIFEHGFRFKTGRE